MCLEHRGCSTVFFPFLLKISGNVLVSLLLGCLSLCLCPSFSAASQPLRTQPPIAPTPNPHTSHQP